MSTSIGKLCVWSFIAHIVTWDRELLKETLENMKELLFSYIDPTGSSYSRDSLWVKNVFIIDDNLCHSGWETGCCPLVTSGHWVKVHTPQLVGTVGGGCCQSVWNWLQWSIKKPPGECVGHQQVAAISGALHGKRSENIHFQSSALLLKPTHYKKAQLLLWRQLLNVSQFHSRMRSPTRL